MSKSSKRGEELPEPEVAHRRQSMQPSEVITDISRLALESRDALVVMINKEHEVTLLNKAAHDFLSADTRQLRPILCFHCHRGKRLHVKRLGKTVI